MRTHVRKKGLMVDLYFPKPHVKIDLSLQNEDILESHSVGQQHSLQSCSFDKNGLIGF